jgi:hypothetical protein
VTLVLTVNGPESIWLVADRRLSQNGRPIRDDACKVMFLETIDNGVAILTGLGATARGTEPADWMSAVLRGRPLRLEQCLSVLGEAIKNQFPRHMAPLSGHDVIIPAFLGNEVRSIQSAWQRRLIVRTMHFATYVFLATSDHARVQHRGSSVSPRGRPS